MNDIEELQEAFKDQTINNERNFDAIRGDIKEIKDLLRPLTETYNGILFSKKFIVGLSGIVIAIAAIGGGFIWLINSIVHRP